MKSLPFIAVFFLTVVVQGLTFYLIPDGQMNDDAAYVLRAMKIAFPDRFAQYHDPTNYAVGWPLLLAPFFWMTNQFYFVGRIVAVFLTALTSVVLFAYFRERSNSSWFATGVVLLFLHSPQIMMLGSSLMSEPLCFFLIISCLYFTTRVEHGWQFAILGLAGALCVNTRMESLAMVVAVAVALWRRRGFSAPLFTFGGGFLAGLGAVYMYVADRNQEAHASAVLGIFKDKSVPELFSYAAHFFVTNSQLIVSSMFGSLPQIAVVVLLVLPVAVIYGVRKNGVKESLFLATKDPALVWLFLLPFILFLWPYFHARYWILWAILSLALALSSFPRKARTVILILLLLVQIPSALGWYRLGPKAKLFQERIYLPYYRELAKAEKVMTLKSARLATLSFVTTVEPLTRTDFQSIPIGMAYLDCSVIEWETSNRHIQSYDGTEVRPFPKHALEGLRNSTLFEPFETCAFSESYRLTADPEALKLAGRLYSEAMQTSDPVGRIKLLEKALDLVGDLPEVRLTYGQSLLALDSESRQGRATLDALFKQYPYMEMDRRGP